MMPDQMSLLKNRLRHQKNELQTHIFNHNINKHSPSTAFQKKNDRLEIKTLPREFRGRPETHESTRLEVIETALDKMNDGSYGVCSSCRNIIPFEQLRSIPYRLRCKECEH